jgi:hypothetical protein
MEMSEVLFNRFKSLRKPSDVAVIAKANHVSKVLIYKALQSGRCSRRVLDMLIEYYTMVEIEMKKVSN